MREGQLETASPGDSEEDLDEDASEPDETGSDEPAIAADGGDAEERRESRHRVRRGRGRRDRGRRDRGRDREERVAFSPAGEAELSGGDTLQPLPAPEEAISVSEASPPPPADFGAPNGAAPIEPAPAPPSEPEAPPLALPEPEPVAVVLTPPDPDRPKRAGWWSKAKSAFGGS